MTTRTLRARGLMMSLVVAMSVVLVACDDDDAPSVSTNGVLQADDLPAEPSASSSATAPPQLSKYCGFEHAEIFAPGFDITGVEYDGVDGATVVSTVSRLEGHNLKADRIDDIRAEFERCAAAHEKGPDGERLKEVPVAAGRFGYESYAKDGTLEGRMGFAYADQAYVSVSTYFTDGKDPGLDLDTLLSRAIDRADKAGPSAKK